MLARHKKNLPVYVGIIALFLIVWLGICLVWMGQPLTGKGF